MKEVLFRVPQSFILGTILLNFFLKLIFIFKDTDFASYADDNTII